MGKSKSPEEMTGSIATQSGALAKEENVAAVKLAHDLEDIGVLRTEDILIQDDVEFKNMLLPEFILNGLSAANFHRPSPIQLRSIPLLRLGLDLIVQSKAGTGKTLIITLAALETINVQSKRLQVVVIAPTREIALQTKNVIATISSDAGVRTEVFIGGTSVKEDKKILLGCQIAIGTPGRLNSLIESGDMSLGHVRLFVLDEADKLMDKSIFSQVKSISKLLPSNKQTILCSATFLHPVKEYVVKHMKEPFWVTPEEATRFQPGNLEQQKSASFVLLGVTQFVKLVQNHAQIVKKLRYKLEEILEILSGHTFTQCIIFSNYQTRAETICHQLVSNGWPAISIRGQDEQSHRTATLTSFKELKCRVLLTTDVMSRGVDFRGVDLVINLDIPYDSATYLHRMGRAGRFGSYGCVITLVCKGEEEESFKKILLEITDTTVYNLPLDLSAIKQGGKLNDIYFGPTEHHLNECVVNKESSMSGENMKGGEIQEQSKIDEANCSHEVPTNANANLIPEDVTSESEQIDVKNEEKTNGDTTLKDISTVEEETLSPRAEPMNMPMSSVNTSSEETQREAAVRRASAHLSEVLLAAKHSKMTFQSFEELENEYSQWILEDSSKSETQPRATEQKHPDWWSSANIVLTAAKLQLQDLKEKAIRKPNQNQDKNVKESDTSSEKITSSAKQYRRKKKKTTKKVPMKAISDSFCKIKQRADPEESLPFEDEGWLWDESSKLYYFWDSSQSSYNLYNPDLKCYFKWEPYSNTYFKWDPVLQKYRLWDCNLKCYSETSEPINEIEFSFGDTNYHSPTSSHDQNYVSWFALWNRHLRQMSWQVYQTEYLKNLCDKFHQL